MLNTIDNNSSWEAIFAALDIIETDPRIRKCLMTRTNGRQHLFQIGTSLESIAYSVDNDRKKAVVRAINAYDTWDKSKTG